MDLFDQYRPTELDSFVADENLFSRLKATLASMKFQCALFNGPSGSGKTSFARMLADRLGASGLDLKEENCGDKTGVDYARDWVKFIQARPMSGKVRVLILDEAHKLTNAAQQCLLKGMEDLYDTNFVIICSTDPEMIITTVRTRCGCKIDFTPTNMESDRLISGLGSIATKLSGADDGGATADKIVTDYLESNSRHTFSVREFIAYAQSIMESGSGSSIQSPNTSNPTELIKFFEEGGKKGPRFFCQPSQWQRVANHVLNLDTTPESCRIRMLRYFTKRWAGDEFYNGFYHVIVGALLEDNCGGPDGEAKLMNMFSKVFKKGAENS